MARLFNIGFDFDVVIKSIRQTISVLAWSWAIFVFILGYFGRGNYNHVNNANEYAPPPLFQSVIGPVLKVLVVAPSAFGLGIPVASKPGSAGHHGSVQSGSVFTPYSSVEQESWALPQQQQRSSNLDKEIGQLCAGCTPINLQASFGNEQPGYLARSNLPVWNQNQQQQSDSWRNQQPQQWNQKPQMQQWNQNEQQQIQQPKSWNNKQKPQQQQWNGNQQDPATVQHMQLNDDGQYSFSYNAGDSSRQEQRNLDGTVVGSYSYTAPEGQDVRVQYSASPKQGFRAFGDGIFPQNVQAQPQQLPVPVQDTPEVQAARAQFFQAYDAQLKLIQMEREAIAARAEIAPNTVQSAEIDAPVAAKIHSVYSEAFGVPFGTVSGGGGVQEDSDSKSTEQSSSEISPGKTASFASASDFKNLPEPIAVPDSNSLGHSEVDEDDEADNDAVVVSADDEDSGSVPRPSFKKTAVIQPQPFTQQIKNLQNQQIQNQGQNQGQVLIPVGPSYTLSYIVGGNGDQVGLRSEQNAFPIPEKSQSNGQSSQSNNNSPASYFYYVSVGGQPHYASNLMRSDHPTSLKVQSAGTLPLAPVHDAQSQSQNIASSPIYLDFNKLNNNNLGGNGNQNVMQQPMQQSGIQQQNKNKNQQQFQFHNFQLNQNGNQSPFVFGFFPATFVGLRQDGQQSSTGEIKMNSNVMQQKSNQQQNQQQLTQIPVVGYPLFYVKTN